MRATKTIAHGYIDWISLILCISLVLTIGFTLVERNRNAFQLHKHWVYSVAADGGDIVASASENQILLWRNKYCIDSLNGHTDAIKSISFSHDSRFLVSGSIDQTVRIWSMADRKELETLRKHTAGVNAVRFSVSDKYVISAGYDGKLLIWDWSSKETLKAFDIKHTGFSISKDDMLAFVDTSCNLHLFDLKSLSLIKAAGQYCGTPAFHPGGKLLAVKTENGAIQFIDSDSGALLTTLDITHGSHYGPFVFTPDGNHVVAGIWGGDIEIWNWQQKKLVKTLHGTPLNSIDDLTFNSKDQLFSAGGDRSVKTWDWKTGSLKTSVGDGSYFKQLEGIIVILVFVILISGFFGVYLSPSNTWSSGAVVLLLSVWGLGILGVALLARSFLARYALAITWVLTVLAGLAVWSLYFVWLAIFLIPVSLFFGYIKLQADQENKRIMIPVVVNLILCGIIVSFIV